MIRRAGRGRRPSPGFTLVEVMVALLIFGMIASAGVGLLSFSVRAQRATDVKLDQVSGVARLGAALASDLAQAQVRPTRDVRGVLRPAFVGEPAGLTLVRGGWNNFDGAARAGVQKASWRLDGGALVREGYPMLDGAAPLDAAVVLDHVRALAFRYRTGGAWTDSWAGGEGVPLPDAVELIAVRDDGVRFRQLFYVGTAYRARAHDDG